MPTFSTTPPADPRGNSLQLIRTPTRGKLSALITSTNLIGTHTHFWHGRTVPCDVDDCKACHDGMPFRWHAWLSCHTSNTKQHVLFEMTAQAAETFVHYRKAHGSLRGAVFNAWRPSGRPNGRVTIVIKPENLDGISIPKEPNLLKALSIIWNIATVDVDVAGLLKDLPRVQVNERNAEVFIPGKPPSRSNGHAKK